MQPLHYPRILRVCRPKTCNGKARVVNVVALRYVPAHPRPCTLSRGQSGDPDNIQSLRLAW